MLGDCEGHHPVGFLDHTLVLRRAFKLERQGRLTGQLGLGTQALETSRQSQMWSTC